MSSISLQADEPTPDPFNKYLRLPPKDQLAQNSADSEDDSDDEDDDDLEGMPISHRFNLEPLKGVQCLKFTTGGNRLIATTRDCSLDVYDFQAMNPGNTAPLRSYEPYETYNVTTLEVNSQGQMLVLADDPKFKLLGEDGCQLREFKSGDRYIYDVKQTKGHTDALTDGKFFNSNKKIVTSSNDSTFRLWDIESSKQDKVNFIKNTKGKKVKVQSVTTTADHIIATDSSQRVTFWDAKSSNFNRPTQSIQLSSDIIGLTTSSTDPTQLVVREDNSLKLYDTRNLSTPLIQRLNFPSSKSSYTKSPLMFYNSHILCPGDLNSLNVLDKSDLMTITSIKTDGIVTALDWNHKVDQIAVGTGEGLISLLFDPKLSRNGAIFTIQNKPKKRHLDDIDHITTKTTQIAYNMEELAEMNRAKKKKKEDHDDLPQQAMIWGTTDSTKI